ncbi:hypothetical protein TPHA_0O00570 [Tetrapisispora phaffii CBS 4417]|uniref:Uncharacterized protein n=1 Tax=Tetrapisispora phaffii (strain ATCC 24235 / CBS 4417 / NBRC 1672 / NRRL Y-8282 / UCD 70-5) TaxID=1071381 RepID=G8C1J9_TETPH|nr:hypothetical protein TPHA_0O00570 [Tetrapisispora phaffii CBS 4417]CCE66027.1 hypothetical protein TPHA_0O00570 [Tetrapisispora phaffii CBS 4417]
MEKLQNLEACLPPEQPPTVQTIDHLQNEISREFKSAANSVAKLYRLSNEKKSLLQHKGYLDCIDDILQTIHDGKEETSVHDIELWCMKKRNELLGPKSNFNFDKNSDNNKKEKEYQLSMIPLSIERDKTKERQNVSRTNRDGGSEITDDIDLNDDLFEMEGGHTEKRPKL